MGDARIEIRIGGTGGQGLILSAKMLADALAAGGKRVAQSQTYEPTSRGGYCNADWWSPTPRWISRSRPRSTNWCLLDRLADQAVLAAAQARARW